jgi:hypothetical protein
MEPPEASTPPAAYPNRWVRPTTEYGRPTAMHFRPDIEPLQGAVSRLTPLLTPSLFGASSQTAGNRRSSQFRRQPWDVAGHVVDQRPVRGSHGKNPAPPMWNDLSARRHDIHLCRASNLGEIRATTTPLKNTDTFLEPQPFKAARGEAVLAQPCRKADKGALVNGPSKGLLVGIVRHPPCSVPWEHPGLPATVARCNNPGVHLEPL